MKKILEIILTVMSLFLFLTCENSISADYQDNTDYSGSVSKKTKNRSGQQGFDLKPYIDASSRNVSAYDLTVYDFEELCKGEFRCGSASIKFNSKEHTVTIRNTDAKVRGTDYQNIFARYEYKMTAAGDNLLYICPVSNKTAEFSSNSQKLDCDSVSPFALYVSFYGFGEGRIEVSSFLSGESIIPGGTYWAVN